MPKRPNPRAIRAARSYTAIEAAQALGYSVGAVRGWVRQGLTVMNAQRPTLILGEALQDYLESRRCKSKTKLESDQLYCLTCKQGEKPLGMMVDCIAQTSKTARLMGLCAVCGGTCNRMISRAKQDSFAKIFDVAYRGDWNA